MSSNLIEINNDIINLIEINNDIIQILNISFIDSGEILKNTNYKIFYRTNKYPSFEEVNKLYWGIRNTNLNFYPPYKLDVYSNDKKTKETQIINSDDSIIITNINDNILEAYKSFKNTTEQIYFSVWGRGLQYITNPKNITYKTNMRNIYTNDYRTMNYVLSDYIKEKIKTLFQYLNKKYKYMVFGGTCIGLLRNGKFLPWDDDIDVGLFENDWNKLYHDTNIEGLGWSFTKENDNVYGIFYRNYFLNRTWGNENETYARFSIDVMKIRENGKNINIGYDNNFWNNVSITKDIIYPFKLTIVDNIDMYLPRDANKMCMLGYGKDFMTNVITINHSDCKMAKDEHIKITDMIQYEKDIHNNYYYAIEAKCHVNSFDIKNTNNILNIGQYTEIIILQDLGSNDIHYLEEISYSEKNIYVITSTSLFISKKMQKFLRGNNFYFLNSFLQLHEYYNFISYIIKIYNIKYIEIHNSIIYIECIYDLKNQFDIFVKSFINLQINSIMVGYENKYNLLNLLKYSDIVVYGKNNTLFKPE